MQFLFCYNGPLCGDGRGDEVCVPVVRRLPSDFPANHPGPRRAVGPRGVGRREGAAPGWS